MSRQEAITQYQQALKAGQKCYRDLVHRGLYPYPHVLDEILDDSMVARRVDLGILDIPSERIVGTRYAGRRSAFAANFMPLLSSETEFASKWINLCESALNSGIRDAVTCCEYLGRFYVQEGNKRVSVSKSFDSPSISAHVTRLVPVRTRDTAIQVYYEFMDFFQKSGTYWMLFSQPGSYAKLQALLGYDADHVWTVEERSQFSLAYIRFREAALRLTRPEEFEEICDAMLVWLQVYSMDQLLNATPAELVRTLTALWPEVQAIRQPDSIEVSTAPQEANVGLLNRLWLPSHLNVAFINEYTPEESTWISGHDRGRQYLESAFPKEVACRTYLIPPNGDAEAVMEKAIAEGAQVLFTTTAPLIAACRKIAVKHRDVHILNCSVSMPYPGVRTYYSRIYEGKFISGAIAGAMCKSDTIGYIASNPIFGVPAGINAFALGARLTNPNARVLLKWSCVSTDPIQELLDAGVDIISNRDVPGPAQSEDTWGLCQLQPDGRLLSLSSPYWNWGNFYVKLVASLLHGSWEEADDSAKAVNYWWGMSSGVVGVHLSEKLPEGVRQLAQMLRRAVIDGAILPFHRFIRAQDGTLKSEGSHFFSAEELLHMDWLCDYVDGSIPTYDELLPMARSIVRLQGIYRDELPVEKDGILL